MFLDIDKLNEHRMKEHTATTPGPSISTDAIVIEEIEPPINHEEVEVENESRREDSNSDMDEDGEQTLVWVKLASMFWPAKLVRSLGELTEIELFDEENSKKTVQNTRLKPFEKLKKVPTKRNKFWKQAYNLALQKLGQSKHM